MRKLWPTGMSSLCSSKTRVTHNFSPHAKRFGKLTWDSGPRGSRMAERGPLGKYQAHYQTKVKDSMEWKGCRYYHWCRGPTDSQWKEKSYWLHSHCSLVKLSSTCWELVSDKDNGTLFVCLASNQARDFRTESYMLILRLVIKIRGKSI